jgi:hypothetical protein
LFWSFCYVVLRRVLQLVALRFRSNAFKELEIVVLRHELAVLRVRSLGLSCGQPIESFLPPPAGCCRERAGGRLSSRRQRCFAGTAGSGQGAGPIRAELVDRRSAARSVSWCWAWPVRIRVGYQRIVGELGGLGFAVSATTVRKLLKDAGFEPAGERTGLSWRDFLRAQAHRRSRSTSSRSRPSVCSGSPRFLLRRARQPPRASRWLHGKPKRHLDQAAGPTAQLETGRALDTGSLPDPGSRQQVHAISTPSSDAKESRSSAHRCKRRETGARRDLNARRGPAGGSKQFPAQRRVTYEG